VGLEDKEPEEDQNREERDEESLNGRQLGEQGLNGKERGEEGQIGDDPEKDAFVHRPKTALGASFVRRVSIYYCDICHKFLPRPKGIEVVSTPEETVDEHCASAGHQRVYFEETKKMITGQNEVLEAGGNEEEDDEQLDYEVEEKTE